MGFFDKLFGRAPKGGEDAGKAKGRAGASRQLPSSMVSEAFGEVNVKRVGAELEIVFTVLMEPVGAEGWQTGVALDASGSMSPQFGKGLDPGPKGDPPQTIWEGYAKKGWLQFIPGPNNQSFPLLSEEAKVDLVERGHFKWSKNEVEPLARKLTAYLASKLDADGGTTVIYWACGDGRQLEVIGDLTAEDCESAPFVGPAKVGFGNGTCLAPAVEYFAERFRDAKNGMYVFITDGALNDLDDVVKLTKRLCKDVAAGRRNPLKCVLIGVGDQINEEQMEELDDLETGTEIDIWDHKVAKEMKGLVEIFAEVVGDNQIVAPSAKLFDDQGAEVKSFSDGMPAKVKFTMPASSAFFELEVEGQRIRQSVVVGA